MQNQEWINNRVDEFKNQFKFDSLQDLQELASSKGLVVKGRSKKAYISVLCDWFRSQIEQEVRA